MKKLLCLTMFLMLMSFGAFAQDTGQVETTTGGEHCDNERIAEDENGGNIPTPTVPTGQSSTIEGGSTVGSEPQRP